MVTPLVAIDLNIDLSSFDIDNDGIQKEKANFSLPDLNVDIARSIPDLNCNPTSPANETFSIENTWIDLNSMPYFEDDNIHEDHGEMGMQISLDPDFNPGMFVFLRLKKSLDDFVKLVPLF